MRGSARVSRKSLPKESSPKKNLLGKSAKCALFIAFLLGAQTVQFVPAAIPAAHAQEGRESGIVADSSANDTPDFQDPENRLSLKADRLVYDENGETITAKGNVQLDYRGHNVIAEQVVYNQKTRRLKAKGKVTLLEPEGNRVIADEIDLTDDFSAGFVSALSIETKDQTFFSAERAEQLEGRTIFHNGVYTACPKCAENPERPRTWRVKAQRITVDSDKRTITYEGARFELFSRPIAYFPRFSHGDPSLKRKDGFLVPEIDFDEDLGVSYRQSYFKTLGKSADAAFSLASYSKQGFLGHSKWRKKTDRGLFSFDFAGLAQERGEKFRQNPDRIRRDRGMVAAAGHIDLNKRWDMGWDVMAQTDDTFSNTYDIDGYSAVNFTNSAYLRGLGEQSSFDLSGYYYDVQGSNFQIEDQQAFVHPVLDYHFIVHPDIGGEMSFAANLTGISRRDLSIDRAEDIPANGIPRIYGIEGFANRASAELEWKKTAGFGGLALTPSLSFYGDVTQAEDRSDSFQARRFDKETSFRFMPTLELKAQYPLLIEARGSSHIIEPMAQILARPDLNTESVFANEDSQSLVFDATSLFDRDKFSGYDRIESGSRANFGVLYSGVFADGTGLTGMIGQSRHLSGDNPYRKEDLVNTGSESGLERKASDYVAALGLTFPEKLSLNAQGRIDREKLRLKRFESLARYDSEKWNLAAQYSHIEGQALTAFRQRREQIGLSGAYDLSERWKIFAGTGFDLENDSFIKNRYGLAYDDLCLALSMTYEETKKLYAATENEQKLGFRIRLRTLGGFGGAGSESFSLGAEK